MPSGRGAGSARCSRRADALIYAEIAQRRTAEDLAGRTDVLSKLLVAAPEQSDTELRDHLVTLLLAGHETTASTLAWTFHDLARRPELQRRVQQAADERDEDYLEAVVKESLRLRPVISNVARRLAKPAHVAGYDLPRGRRGVPVDLLVQRTASAVPVARTSSVRSDSSTARRRPGRGSRSAAASAAASARHWRRSRPRPC